MPLTSCVFVVSFPRSGTHCLLDFIRLNFPAFKPSLNPWESSSKLYLRLDNHQWREEAAEFIRAGRSHLLIKSHFAGFQKNTHTEAIRLLQPKDVIFLYPFRRFSDLVRSYAGFQRWRMPASQILNEPSERLASPGSVFDCIHQHAAFWMRIGAFFVNYDRLVSDPETAALSIGELLNMQPASIPRRLPRHKISAGKFGELFNRLSGRESTEVLVKPRLEWQDANEPLMIDQLFSDLYSQLLRRAVNGHFTRGLIQKENRPHLGPLPPIEI